MKRIIFMIFFMFIFCNGLYAEDNAIKVSSILEKATSGMTTGFYLPLAEQNKVDSNLKYSQSYTKKITDMKLANDKIILGLDIGYVPSARGYIGVSYEIGNLTFLKNTPILDKIDLSLGFGGTFDFEESNLGCGFNLRVIKFEW